MPIVEKYRDDDDNFIGANDDEGDEEEEDDADDFFNVTKPTSWYECLHMVISKDEERLLMLQNPDGLLYLTFLKKAGFLFLYRKWWY